MRLRTLALVLLSTLVSPLAQAQTYPKSWSPDPPPRLIEDRLRLEVNGMGVSMDTRLRVDLSDTVRGTYLDAEKDLGLDDFKMLPQVELTLLPGKRHLVRLTAFRAQRSAQHVIDRDIVFDDEVYRANERVDSELNFSFIGVAYGYRFIAAERGELAATFGVNITEVEANAVVLSRVQREADDAVLPIPLLGLEGRVAFSSRWSIEGRAQYLGGEKQQVDAFISDLRGAFTWRQNPHLVWGLGYRSFKIKVDSSNEGDTGRVDLHFNGPELYVRASL